MVGSAKTVYRYSQHIETLGIEAKPVEVLRFQVDEAGVARAVAAIVAAQQPQPGRQQRGLALVLIVTSLTTVRALQARLDAHDAARGSGGHDAHDATRTAILVVGLRAQSHLSLCTAAHPLHIIFSNIFGAFISEATARPNPRSAR